MDYKEGIQDEPFTWAENKRKSANGPATDRLSINDDEDSDKMLEIAVNSGNGSAIASCMALNEEDEAVFSGSGLSNEVVDSAASACNSILQGKNAQDVIEDVFNSLMVDGLVEVEKVIDFLKTNTDNVNERESALENLCYLFDSSGENVKVNFDVFRIVMNDWVKQLQNFNSPSHNSCEESVNLISFCSIPSSRLTSSPIPGRQSSFGLVDHALLANCSFGSLEGIGGDITQKDELELAVELKEMQLQNKHLKERLSKLKIQVISTEEHNSLLSDENIELNKNLLSCQSAVMKTKSLEDENFKLIDQVAKCENDKVKLLNQIKELKFQNSQLEEKIVHMKEELSILWADYERMKLSKENLKKDLCELKFKIEALELSIETKDAKLSKEIKKSEEYETLIFNWRTHSEMTQVEKDRLEFELSKALQDNERLRNRFKLSPKFMKSKSSSFDSNGNGVESVVYCKDDKEISYMSLPILSIRQEMEGLVDEADAHPSPFCEKVLIDKFDYSENSFEKLNVDEGDEGVVEDSTDEHAHVKVNSLEDSKTSRNLDTENLAIIWEIISATRKETDTLFWKLNKRLTSCCCSNSSSLKLPAGSGDDETWTNKNEISRNDDHQLDLGVKISMQCQVFQDDVRRCIDLLSREHLCTHRCVFLKPANGYSMWGKSKDLSDLTEEYNLHNSSGKITEITRSSHSGNVDLIHDVYQRLLETIRNSVNSGHLFEDGFYKLFCTLNERRVSLDYRLQLQQEKRSDAKDYLIQEVLKIKNIIQNSHPVENPKEYVDMFEKLINSLVHESESYGAIKEEKIMYSFIDELVQYFDKIYPHREKNVPQINGCSSDIKCFTNITPIKSETKCQTLSLSNASANKQNINEVTTNSSTRTGLAFNSNQFYSVINCWRTKLSEFLWTFILDTYSMNHFFPFFGVIVVVLLITVLYYILSYDSAYSICSNNLKEAACARSWSEILKPHIQQRHPPHIF